MKQKLLLVAAVFFGLLAFVLTYQQIEHERNKVLGMTRDVSFVAFKRAMAGGEIIKAEDIERQDEKRIRRQELNEVVWAQSSTIIGRTLDISVAKGHVLLWSDLKPASVRKEGLASILPMGSRAVSISVDNISSVAGLVRPGNKVDIIATFRFPEMQGDRSLDTLTMTLLQNVTILATGNDMGKALTPQGTTAQRSYSSVTISLTPKEVEMIIFAEQKGKLSLSLRSYEETAIESDLPSVNFRYLEKNLKTYNEERAKRMHFNRN